MYLSNKTKKRLRSNSNNIYYGKWRNEFLDAKRKNEIKKEKLEKIGSAKGQKQMMEFI